MLFRSAAVDNDTEDNKTCARGDLHHTEYEFDFTISTDAKDLDQGQDSQEDSNPDLHDS